MTITMQAFGHSLQGTRAVNTNSDGGSCYMSEKKRSGGRSWPAYLSPPRTRTTKRLNVTDIVGSVVSARNLSDDRDQVSSL